MINVPLLRKVLEHITLNPLEWDQSTWSRQEDESPCGTACCLAGHTAVMSGVPLRYEQIRGVQVPYISKDGRALSAVASDELGLDYFQAECIYAASNSLLALWEYAEVFSQGEIKASEMCDLLESR